MHLCGLTWSWALALPGLVAAVGSQMLVGPLQARRGCWSPEHGLPAACHNLQVAENECSRISAIMHSCWADSRLAVSNRTSGNNAIVCVSTSLCCDQLRSLNICIACFILIHSAFTSIHIFMPICSPPALRAEGASSESTCCAKDSCMRAVMRTASMSSRESLSLEPLDASESLPYLRCRSLFIAHTLCTLVFILLFVSMRVLLTRQCEQRLHKNWKEAWGS